MANVIRHKRGTSDPVANDFNNTAELLVNTTDGTIFTKNDSSSVIEFATISTTQTLTNKTLGDLKETVFTITDGSSVDLDPANGSIQLWTLAANRTVTANNFAAGESMLLMVDDGAGYAITWPTTEWIGGSAPTLGTSEYNAIELFKVGSDLYGVFIGEFAA